MRAVVQRVSKASVAVGGETVGRIEKEGAGLLVFLGVGREDDSGDLEWLVDRLLKLRIFADAGQKMNRSLADVSGDVLVISQFTLYGTIKKGNRPSFNRAAEPSVGQDLYERFIARLSEKLGKDVPGGRFAEHMTIDAQNDGPVTLILDTKQREF